MCLDASHLKQSQSPTFGQSHHYSCQSQASHLHWHCTPAEFQWGSKGDEQLIQILHKHNTHTHTKRELVCKLSIKSIKEVDATHLPLSICLRDMGWSKFQRVNSNKVMAGGWWIWRLKKCWSISVDTMECGRKLRWLNTWAWIRRKVN